MEALESVKRDAKIKAYGYDIDPQAVELTMANAKKAGVSAHIRTKVQNISQLSLARAGDCDLQSPLWRASSGNQRSRTALPDDGKGFPC